jgi:hypothetical protein
MDNKKREPITIHLPKDFTKKLAIAAFFIAIVTLIVYQLSFALVPSNAPFQEPDNYEYYLFARLAIAHGSLNVSNPYLINASAGFFEHPGLYQIPVFLHNMLPFLSLFWDFRIPYILVVFGIYAVTLLITKRILDGTLLNDTYKYVGYTLVLFNYFLLQQTELNEWRGNTFITLMLLLMFYIIAYAYSEKLSWNKKIALFSAVIGLLALSWYMWSGWYIAFVPLLLIPVFEIYKRVKTDKLYWGIALLLVISAFLLGFASSTVDYYIILFFHEISFAFPPIASLLNGLNCYNNPLQIGEINCLTGFNGLISVVTYLIFFAFAVLVFLKNRILSISRESYEYFLIGAVFLSLVLLIPALVYLRMIQTVAPYLAIGFGCGTAALMARGGASRIVQFLVVLAILIGAFGGILLFWQATYQVYSLNNPQGLINTSTYISQHSAPNTTVLTFYGWAWALEYYGHVKVYADTVQGLRYNVIIPMDNFFYSSPVNCTYLYKLKPDYVLTSPDLSDFGLFNNASNNSVSKNPNALTQCGYDRVYTSMNFSLYKNG